MRVNLRHFNRSHRLMGLFSGSGVGGVVFPITLPILVNRYGPSTTLKILSVTIVVFILPGIPFLRPRLPERRVHAPESHEAEVFKVEWLKSPPFMLALAANTLQGLAYFVPLLWLPSEMHSV